ncbi:AAA family ATPase [Nocardia farcinica]|uniref:AAA family ATPase n=1 Tax=Nocardia farcinica TaxID=37329 RepID=UPI00378D77D5
MSDYRHTQGAATPAAPSGAAHVRQPEPTAHCYDHAVYDAVCFSCQAAYREQIREERARRQDRSRTASGPGPEPYRGRTRTTRRNNAADQQKGAAVVVLEPDARQDHSPSWSGPGPGPDQAAQSSGSLLSSMVSGAWLDAQTFPPLEWLVDGILTEGFGLLVSPPKAGKSWMVAGIGLACAAGGYALGSIVVKQRPVLYLALEDGHRRLQSRFRTLTEGQPIPAGINVIISARPNEVPGMIAEFLHLHHADKPLVILDTLGKVKPPKQSGQESYSADYAFGSQLKTLVDSTPGACLLAVHHTRKAESGDFVDAVSGTQGIAGSADFILVLTRKRKDDQAVLAVTGRDVPENEYALVTEGGRWRLDGMDLTDAAAAVERRRSAGSLGDRSMDVLAHVMTNGPTTPRDIADTFGIDNKTASVYLSRLHESGRIAKLRRGTYDRMPTGGVESVESVETSE